MLACSRSKSSYVNETRELKETVHRLHESCHCCHHLLHLSASLQSPSWQRVRSVQSPKLHQNCLTVESPDACIALHQGHDSLGASLEGASLPGDGNHQSMDELASMVCLQSAVILHECTSAPYLVLFTCRYRQLTMQNATSLARRFQNLQGLQLVVQTELKALDAARKAALADLDRLAQACQDPSPDMVEQVTDCPNLPDECWVHEIMALLKNDQRKVMVVKRKFMSLVG